MYFVAPAHEMCQYFLMITHFGLKHWECNSVNKAVLTYCKALVEFLRKILTSVHRYEQHKVHIVYVNDINCLISFSTRNVAGGDAKFSANFLL